MARVDVSSDSLCQDNIDDSIDSVSKTKDEPITFDFKTKTWKEDLTIIIEDTKLYVNKSVMAFASPVFEKMFSGECQDKRIDEIELSDTNCEDFCEFLRCIYPNRVPKLTKENVGRIIYFADKYQVQHLKVACEEFLLASLLKETDTIQLFKILNMACSYGLQTLRKKCISLAVDKPQNQLDEANKAVIIPADAKCDIQQRIIVVLIKELLEVGTQLRTSMVLSNILAFNASNGEQLLKYQRPGVAEGNRESFQVELNDLSGKCEVRFRDMSMTISLDRRPATPYAKDMYVTVESTSKETFTANIICMFVIKNWMQNKTTKLITWTAELTSTLPVSSECFCSFSELNDETNGFQYKGKIQCEIFLLKF